MLTVERGSQQGRVVPPMRSHYDERLWKSYYTEMLLQHDSGSEYATSYGTRSASPCHYQPGNGMWTPGHTTDGRLVHERYGDIITGANVSKSIAWIWVLLSTTVFGLCTFSLSQPYWFIGSGKQKESLGVINYCVQRENVSAETCELYAGYFSMEGVPTLSWKTTLLLYAAGCIIQALASMLAALCLCVAYKHRRRLSLVAGYFQLFSVILLITGLLIYPVGLDATISQTVCGASAGMYSCGTCNMGWSYALAITSTALGVFCPVLSHYIESPS